uniref:Uncharacterized protein LOC100180813 n=1 Tax=Phallusia mammillata TaxID=59560 RepID=A0A6F9DHZ8_9ASCI|nr:uncharacterized protein LOC100180813 [Phallusia mammillata]
MQATSPGRRPVFSYTKISTKPPFTTIAEQNYWAHPASNPALNSMKDKTYLSYKRRPKSSGLSGPNHIPERIQRPKSSYIPSDNEICVKGDRYLHGPTLTPDQHLSHQSTNDSGSSTRCPTPDYMKNIYDEYSDNFCEHLLLRRPLYKSLPSILSNDDAPSEFGSQQKPVSSRESPNCTEKDPLLKLTHAETVGEIKPTETINPSKDIPLCKLEKTKVAIDITLCDSKGCIIGTDPGPLPSPESEELELFCEQTNQSLLDDDFRINTPPGSPRVKISGTRNKRRPSRHNKRRPRNTSKRRTFEPSTVAIDYTDAFNNGSTEAPTSKTTENNTKQKSSDEIVTQMAALGLAKPLDDDDLHLLMQRKAIPKFQQKRRYASKKKNCTQSEPDVKNRSRRIPIQIISDPFKCVGGRSTPTDTIPAPRQALSARPLIKRPGSERWLQRPETATANFSPKSVTPKQSFSNSSKSSDDSLNSDVRLIRDKLLKVGVRLSGKKLQRCLQSPREKAPDDCVIRLRHMSSLSLLSEPKRWFEEDGD